jgi:hypothetical protein
MGRILHSTNACINIVNHIGDEIRNLKLKKIVDSNSKISLIIDEYTVLSKRSTLIVFARVFFQDSNLTEPINLFTDLIELDDVSDNGIFTALISHLEFVGVTEEFLTENLVSLTCDGAAVMFGSHGGVSKLFKDKFPSIIVWHCANHRLELSVHDTIKNLAGTNRLKSFLDKLYVVYHASPKNARELQSCTTMLDMQVLTVGRVLGTQWVASSFCSVMAVWQDYRALVLHFEEAKNDKNRDKKERCPYEGLLRKIISVD